MTRRRWLVLAYLALVVASRVWIAFMPAEPPLPPGMQRVRVAAWSSGHRTKSPIEIAYRSLGPRSPDAVLLLHGSPGSLQDFEALAARLGPRNFIVVPDLAGFGASTHDVPDHSFAAQADHLLQLLDTLEIERAHVVGFSWGGGVAIELADRAPERVESLVLVSALGVQEHELLGRYELNHLVHRLQQVLVATVDWAIPHFGAFDAGHGLRGFTHSFVDSDQRPLRAALGRYARPLLILHGRQDFLVPAAAAREHHRIVPQSRIVWLDGGHLVLWRNPDAVATALDDWFDAARRGRLETRPSATPRRVAAAAAPFAQARAGPQNGLGWVVFFLLVLAASLVGEDLTCIGVGMLVAIGQVGWLGGISACVVALVAGDLLLYTGGRIFGPPLLRRIGRDPSEISGIRARFERSGGLVVLLGRFVPGARLPTYVAAGALGYPVATFAAWLTLAALLWAPALVGATALGGRALEGMFGSKTGGYGLGLALVLFTAIAARIAPRAATARGRRLLRSRWQRFVRWEFWPIWAIYLPMAPAIAALALKHRSLRVVTLVNPPIPGGGLAGESKAAIGRLLATLPEHSIATEILEPAVVDERCASVSSFMTAHGIGFPIVLKPDVGERGRDVVIAPDAAAVRCYFERHRGPALAQQFVTGDEFGIFYTRCPGESVGQIFSLARKTPRFVTGNGIDTLEQLILSDPICLPVAEKLSSQQADRLEWIPAERERIRLTQLGTHSLGCRFLVGEDLRSDALEAAVDRLSRSAGLDFGRYDVRAPSEQMLRAGQFKVVEFNGLTGEAAHMYDPRFGLFEGLRILRSQWRRGFEIGAAHRARGRKPLSWRALASLVRSARQPAGERNATTLPPTRQPTAGTGTSRRRA